MCTQLTKLPFELLKFVKRQLHKYIYVEITFLNVHKL